MKRCYGAWAPPAHLLLCLLLLAACGGKDTGAPDIPPPPPATDPTKVIWQADPQGLRLRITTSGDLNKQDGVPLGLSLCLYQLGDKVRFEALAQTASGLDSLLDCAVDKADARSAKEFLLQPGQSLEMTLERAEQAKYLAVVAGYFHLKPDLSTFVFPYLLHSETEGWIPFFRDTVYSAAQMDIIINLNETSVDVKGVERE
ncbi:MAG: type VI secretion system lipoprotein TssJ [Desulfovibrio sp.]|jgi:type VI secretion system VasD/TssJ family lipoprotein|nr:type VI secretion system lipoprotein TssJ [Desulfovibrio sp.]